MKTKAKQKIKQLDIANNNPWGGRFTRAMTPNLINFNTSIPIENRLFPADIMASIAHVKMLAKVKLIKSNEKNILVNALKSILIDWRNGKIEFKPELEDIHMNLETLLVSKVGNLGKKIHTARSRNDQQAVAQRLYFKESTYKVIKAINDLQRIMYKHCWDYRHIIMPSYTHLQRAEFTYYGHWLATYIIMLERDRQRLIDCYNRADECPLGACASTGTSLPIDRSYVAKLLGFKRPTQHSIDSVSDRDYLLEFTNCATILMIHLSRLAEEIIYFTSQEFNFIKLSDAYCTGSSIMPQKKNPDILELIRGKAGTVIGNHTSLLAIVKNLSLGYNKDFQEDKYAWFSALDNSLNCLLILGDVISTMYPLANNMLLATQKGHIIATEYANYLATHGISFREAHRLVGEMVKQAEAEGCDISVLPKELHPLLKEAMGKLTIKNCIQHKNSVGSCGDKALTKLFSELRKTVFKH